jgi:methylase of polypeptide subunit release factors
MVDTVVDETLGPALARAGWDGPAPCLRVLDPACGDGRFLVACAARLADAAAARGHDRAAARRAVVGRCLVGVERDPAAAAAARAALGPGADVRVAEALTSGAAAARSWDVVVGNPPWIRSVALRAADPALWRRLRGAFAATSHREWDLYGAFVEQALAWVAPGGQIGLVTPSRWLTAAFAARLRGKLAAARAVRKVVDFGARQLFDGATTYSALVFLSPDGADSVDVDGGQVPAARLGEAPWVLAAGAAAARLDALAAIGPPLGRVARIAKGAGTNADPVFLLERRGAGWWSPALAAVVDVEDAALVPCLRGRDVAGYAATVRRHALLPYEGGRLLPFAELARRHPGAAAYLERCRPLLEARERGRFRGAGFHAWGRPQNLAWHLDPAPKIVIPDAAAAGRAALDRGTLAIDTAYAVRATGAAPLGLLLAVLNHALVGTWLRARGIPLRGGYFRMKTAYLESLPVPEPTTPAARRAAACALAGDAAGAAAALAEVVP